MTVISEDHRKLLIDIFFAVIITIGLEKFLHTFLLGHIHTLNSFDISTLLNTFSAPEILFNMFFFFAAYFWVISHWVFYHELIKKYPYYRCGKFLVDVAIFSIMFVIINISFSAYNNAILSLFILLIAIWYFFACLWHLSDKGLRPLHRYLSGHIERLATYLTLLALSYDPFSISQDHDWYRYVIMSSVIIAMIVWNVHRLNRYIDRDIREYNSDYIKGCPDLNSPHNGGKLSLEIYKRKIKYTNNKREDKIIFKAPDSEDIPILAKDIFEASIISGNEELDEDDGMIQIICRYKNSDTVTPIFRLKNDIIRGVLAGINELIREDKKLTRPIQLIDKKITT
jgi:hypothetical protein